MSESVAIALATGAASGLVTWGMVKVELRWLRRDIDSAFESIKELQRVTRLRGSASDRIALPD